MIDSDDIENFYFDNLNCSSNDFSSINNNSYLLSSKFNLIHQNIRSCNQHLDEFLGLLKSCEINFHAMMFSETWYNTSNIPTVIPDFLGFHSTRSGKIGSGVSIYIHKKFNAVEIPSLNINNELLECVGVKLQFPHKNFNFICIYKPPSVPLESFNNYFSELIGNLPKNEINYIGGDFNIDLLDSEPSNATLSFKEIITSNFYSPLINLPTRICETRNSCIDHIYYNSTLPVASGTLQTVISDHLAIFATVPVDNNYIKDKFEFKFRNHSNDNLLLFRHTLINEFQNFGVYDEFSVEDRTSIFLNILQRTYEASFPIMTKQITYKRFLSPWISDELIERIKLKHILYYRSLGNPLLFDNYKKFSKDLKISIKCAKKTIIRENLRLILVIQETHGKLLIQL